MSCITPTTDPKSIPSPNTHPKPPHKSEVPTSGLTALRELTRARLYEPPVLPSISCPPSRCPLATGLECPPDRGSLSPRFWRVSQSPSLAIASPLPSPKPRCSLPSAKPKCEEYRNSRYQVVGLEYNNDNNYRCRSVVIYNRIH